MPEGNHRLLSKQRCRSGQFQKLTKKLTKRCQYMPMHALLTPWNEKARRA